MSTRNLPGSKGRPEHNADKLTATCEPIVYKKWELRRITTLWASTAWNRDAFTGIETKYFNKIVELIFFSTWHTILSWGRILIFSSSSVVLQVGTPENVPSQYYKGIS
jgi:hypothetical protein